MSGFIAIRRRWWRSSITSRRRRTWRTAWCWCSIRCWRPRNSAIAAVDRLKEAGAKNIRVVCLLAAPEGIEKFHAHHPEVHIWTAAIDEKLNDHGYIVPGLGDAGDRMYGTK